MKRCPKQGDIKIILFNFLQFWIIFGSKSGVSATFYKIQRTRKAFGAPTKLVAEWGEEERRQPQRT